MTATTSSIWDYCYLDSEIIGLVDEMAVTLYGPTNGSTMQVSTSGNTTLNGTASVDNSNTQQCKENNIEFALSDAEKSCGTSLSLLDSILSLLDDVSSAHNDVTGRTNSLMTTCESLLEQQVFES